jgi:hypothetical protein
VPKSTIKASNALGILAYTKPLPSCFPSLPFLSLPCFAIYGYYEFYGSINKPIPLITHVDIGYQKNSRNATLIKLSTPINNQACLKNSFPATKSYQKILKTYSMKRIIASLSL